jgi:hypothetical protein
MAPAENPLTLEAGSAALRAARVAALNANQRDARLAWSRLVSGSVTLRFEFLLEKTAKNPHSIAFTERQRPGLLAAAFEPRSRRVTAGIVRLGESYVAARRPLGERRLGGC